MVVRVGIELQVKYFFSENSETIVWSSNIFIYLLIFELRWVFFAASGLSLVAVSRDYSSLRHTGFSLWWLLLLQSTGSRAHGLSTCCSWALIALGMWDLPRPRIEPMSPALAGGFLSTVPPGTGSLLSVI